MAGIRPAVLGEGVMALTSPSSAIGHAKGLANSAVASLDNAMSAVAKARSSTPSHVRPGRYARDARDAVEQAARDVQGIRDVVTGAFPKQVVSAQRLTDAVEGLRLLAAQLPSKSPFVGNPNHYTVRPGLLDDLGLARKRVGEIARWVSTLPEPKARATATIAAKQTRKSASKVPDVAPAPPRRADSTPAPAAQPRARARTPEASIASGPSHVPDPVLDQLHADHDRGADAFISWLTLGAG